MKHQVIYYADTQIQHSGNPNVNLSKEINLLVHTCKLGFMESHPDIAEFEFQQVTPTMAATDQKLFISVTVIFRFSKKGEAA